MASSSDINVLQTALQRLELQSDDPLKDLNLSVDEFALVAKASAALQAGSADPLSLKAALEGSNRENWINAMQEEVNSLLENETFDLKSSSTSAGEPSSAASSASLLTKWVFKTKRNADSSKRFKAQLVVRGFEQTEGVNYNDTYAPVATHMSFRLLIALSTMFDWRVHQLDVVTAFLHPKINRDDIWITIPKTSLRLITGLPNSRLRLRKALYGLRQSPRLWWHAINDCLTKMGLLRGNYDINIYIGRTVIVLLYVDDILIFDTSKKEAKDAMGAKYFRVTSVLTSTFKMKHLGILKQFLGYEISRNAQGYLGISQRTYIETIVKRYGCEDSAPTPTPADDRNRIDNGANVDRPLTEPYKVLYQSIIGALLYAALGSRPDIAYTVSALSRHCSQPTTSHLSCARRVLKYLNSTLDLQLYYSPKPDVGLRGACDAD